MSTSTLEQLLAEAQEDQESSEDLGPRIAELQDQTFSVSEVYQEHREELLELVKPLQEFLPNVAEYEAYAAPREGVKAGANWDKTARMDPARKLLRVENPAMIMLTQCNRVEQDEIPFAELSDDEYAEYLDNVQLMANWWEHAMHVDELQLAKSIIVHTVLQDPVLAGLTFSMARKNISSLMEIDADLASWREGL